MKSRELRYFTKLDSNGKPVPGVLVARLKNPENTDKNTGHWMEVIPPNCCVCPTVTASVVGTQANSSGAQLQLFYNGVSMFNTLATTVDLLITRLSTNNLGFGTYTKVDLTNDTIRIDPSPLFCKGLTATLTYNA